MFAEAKHTKTRRPTKISFPSVADHDAITGVRPALGPAASLLRSTLVRGKTPCVRRKAQVLEASENRRCRAHLHGADVRPAADVRLMAMTGIAR